MIDEKSSFDEEHDPEVELNPLHSSLRYKFLKPNSTYPVILNASVSPSQVDSYFCYLDGYSDCFQIPIHPSGKEKTTSNCDFSHGRIHGTNLKFPWQ